MFASKMLAIDKATGLRIVETAPSSDPRWEPFVTSRPDSSIYHHPAWITALEREYGQEGAHLGCETSEGELVAVLPMLYTRGLPFRVGGVLTGRRLSSLPRTPLAGPLSSTPGATRAIVEAAMAKASLDGRLHLQIKAQGAELSDMTAGLACTPWRLSYVLDLAQFHATGFRIANSHTRATVKWSINKAARLGVRVRKADSEHDLKAWYPLYLDSMRRNAVPARSYRFFRDLWRLLTPKGLLELVLAELHDSGNIRLLAGSIFLLWGPTISYAFNGSRLSDLSLRPNDVIQWQAIGDAIQKKFRTFDFGEVAEEHSELAVFKRKWGSQPVRLYRYYYPTLEKSGTLTNESKRRKMAEAVWRLIPLRATALLSDHIYRFL